MQFIGWMYDIAREQAPSEDRLREVLGRSKAAGYTAVGLYLEHRFAYPSAPWAAAQGCLTPDVVRRLRAEAVPTGLRVVPFLNTLGHMEGFIRSEVMRCEDLLDLGSERNVKEAGRLMQKGRDHVVEDGEVHHFLFKV